MEMIAVDVCFAQQCICCKLQQKYLSKSAGVFWTPVSHASAITIDVN